MKQRTPPVSPRRPRVQGLPSARYVYCIAPSRERVALGPVGIEKADVYTVVVKDVCAVVHQCLPAPYRSEGAEVVTGWVLEHHRVVETAWKRWGAVLPMVFNTIVSDCRRDAEGALTAWIEDQLPSLKLKLEAINGKAEYVVQVFRDPAVSAREVTESSPRVSGLLKAMGSSPRGLAYMLRHQVERALKEEMEVRATEQTQALRDRLTLCVDAIRVEKPKDGGPDGHMLLNASCLVAPAGLAGLQKEVERINGEAGLSVRLAGPLPPYSFC